MRYMNTEEEEMEETTIEEEEDSTTEMGDEELEEKDDNVPSMGSGISNINEDNLETIMAKNKGLKQWNALKETLKDRNILEEMVSLDVVLHYSNFHFTSLLSCCALLTLHAYPY